MTKYTAHLFVIISWQIGHVQICRILLLLLEKNNQEKYFQRRKNQVSENYKKSHSC